MKFHSVYLSLIYIIGLLLVTTSSYSQEAMSPTAFVGDDYGKQFTPHHILVDYFQHLVASNENILLEKYGETNEGRPLYLAMISSQENINDLAIIQQTNLYNAGLESEKPERLIEKSIVWLSYSVHGNEAGGSESSMNVAYELLHNYTKYKDWLDEVVVIIDPSLNPDGYSRYSHWFRGISGTNLHPDHTDVEHMEPWPGGRVNHYLFDLNRDWAWQTQVETQQRIAIYNKWMPHVHADLHEMGYDDHYYFAPAAEPFHKAITDWQRSLQYDIGKNHAKYFDQEGWLYFTREIFDLLYPSYGDTWPTFNGSIGMTYEQAGHGMSGRSIKMSNGKDLTLQDRIDHHTSTSLSTIETAAIQHEAIVRNFKSYFEKAVSNPVGKFMSYVIRKGQLTPEFKELLTRNAIQFSSLSSGQKLTGYDYNTNKNTTFQTQIGDIFISAKQPKSTLLQVLMEQEPVLADSVTYDITSWSIPYAYGLDCYGMTSIPKIQLSNEGSHEKTNTITDNYAYAFSWNKSWKTKQFLADLLTNNILVKAVQNPIELENTTLRRGDLLVLRGDQSNEKTALKMLASLIIKHNIECIVIESGFAVAGSDLGGSGLTKIKAPHVLTFFGDGVNANAYGQVWHFFETRLDYPISRVDIDVFGRIDLDDFNTIILPDGYYSLSEEELAKLAEWVSSGGKLISVRGANRVLKSSKFFGIGKNEESKDSIETDRKEDELRDRKRKYEGSERRSIAGSIPGAIFPTIIDDTHPLCFGIDKYYSLKNSSSIYPLLGNGAYNPIRIPTNYKAYGFIGSELANKFDDNFIFAVDRQGGGKVIYMADNPLFRAFWKSGELIFANALFQVK